MATEDRQLNLPKREEEVLAFWQKHKIFKQTLERTKKGKPFIFYEGPPTANAAPGIHHVEARAFKDVIPRYKTMRGFFVPRRAGWDTHGLPVELQIEKELGFTQKQDIETYGIGPFNAKAKELVWRFKEEWERLTHRIGFWLDLENPYITYEPRYMETLWQIIARFWKEGLLEEDFKIVPWCSRCQTGLSSHELAQGYRTVQDRSVYVRFRIKFEDPRWHNTYILSWTTTPWTLPGNVALAVHPDLTYIKVRAPEALPGGVPIYYLFAKDREDDLAKKFGPFGPIEKTIKGNELVGMKYRPLFDIPELQSEKSWRVYEADFVTAHDGTGVVHTAVMYGEDDYQLGKRAGLPMFHTVNEKGEFIASVGEGLAGLKAKDPETEGRIIEALKKKRFFVSEESHEHEYPFCWRCGTPILYFARNAWWVRVSHLKKKLLAANETINWVPAHLKHGRFGEFLKDVRDWAFSRERYWGTPLPIWRCQKCGAKDVIGSLTELSRKMPAAKNTYMLLRHGEAVSNVKRIASSKGEGHRLTPKGRVQAKAAAKKLAKEGIDEIWASPLLRTRETAQIVGKALDVPVHYDDRLREINVGVFDNRPSDEYHRYFRSYREKFWKRPPEGENLQDVRGRIMAWVKEKEQAKKGKHILVISHEYSLWMLLVGNRGLSDNEAADIRVGRREKDFMKTGELMPAPYIPLPRDETGEMNIHRPYVDEITLPCPQCPTQMRRIPDVADVWFDSGAMPFAQSHWPFAPHETFLFPADYIAEAVDQTRGWFYTLLAVSTLLGMAAPYKNVISLGHVLDKNGQKMSKSKGNVVNPWEMIEKYGVDSLRWYFYTVNPPGEPKRFDEKDLTHNMRSFLGTLWNSFVLFDTYTDKIKPRPAGEGGNVLDMWITENVHACAADVTGRLEAYDIMGAARALEKFVISDFSQWYLRRSRARFQRPENKKEKEEAAATTAYVLDTVCRLAAPFTPFLAEAIYQKLRKKTGSPEISVHLLLWPETKGRSRGAALRLADMTSARAVVAEALRLRAEAGIRVRQPLAVLQTPTKLSPALSMLVKEEINVKDIVVGPELKLDTTLTPQLREEGIARELARNIQELRRDAGLKPKQVVRVFVSGDEAIVSLALKWTEYLLRGAGLKTITVGKKAPVIAEREMEIEGSKIWVGIAK